MQQEIQILDQLVDMALAAGIFKDKNNAGMAINAIGVIKSQVPELANENKQLKEQLANSSPFYEEKPGPTKTTESEGDKPGPSQNKKSEPPSKAKHKQN